MQIIDKELSFTAQLYSFTQPVKYIVLHHEAAPTATVEEIHRYHITNNGWSGIAYHLYVRKDGKVYKGRPIDKVGGHCKGYNSISIGICCEGNFEVEQMSGAQFNALCEAIRYVMSVYPNAQIVGHKELNPTACPGRYFPLATLKEVKLIDIPDWAKPEYEEAKKIGITDGTRPNDKATRLEVMLMILRAIKFLRGEK